MFTTKKGAPLPKLEQAYDEAAAGKPIMDTLLDAFSFFGSCDDRLVKRESNGQIAGFPLPPLPVANRYRRLHPDWPSEEDWNRTERERITGLRPGGLRRRITGRMTTDEETILCGMTELGHGRSEIFLEPEAQVVHDIALGYPYVLEVEGTRTPLTVVEGTLHANGRPFKVANLPAVGNAEPWPAWWAFCLDDASYYRRRRHLPVPRD